MRVNKWQRPDLFLINVEAITKQCKDFPYKGQSIRRAIKQTIWEKCVFLSTNWAGRQRENTLMNMQLEDKGLVIVRRQQQTSCLSLPTNVQSRILQQTLLWQGTKRAKIEFQNRSQGWIQHNHSSGRDKKISDCLLLVLQIRLLSQNKPMLQSYVGMTA